jgi:hypothetical protein
MERRRKKKKDNQERSSSSSSSSSFDIRLAKPPRIRLDRLEPPIRNRDVLS